MEKTIPDPGFEGDDGTADPSLAAALAGYAAGGHGHGEVLSALLTARLLVPVVAVLASEAVTDGGLRQEKDTDMALVTLVGPDGRKALPAFTSLAAMARWHPEARPVPVTAQRAGEAAFFEEAALVVIDPAGPVTFLVQGPALRALAEGRTPLPPAEDPEVRAAVEAAVAGEPEVAAVRLLPAEDSDGTLALVLAPGVDPVRARAAAERVAGALAQDPTLRSRLDRGLDIALLPPEAASSRSTSQ